MILKYFTRFQISSNCEPYIYFQVFSESTFARLPLFDLQRLNEPVSSICTPPPPSMLQTHTPLSGNEVLSIVYFRSGQLIGNVSAIKQTTCHSLARVGVSRIRPRDLYYSHMPVHSEATAKTQLTSRCI